MISLSNFLLAVLLGFFLLTGCTSSKVTGLWHVQKVQVGQKEMTPIARWVRFNKDGSQQSGNGWFQHSIGTWNLDKQNEKLRITNTNGFEDNNPPFAFSFNEKTMIWEREEEGQTVRVTLEKGETLPQSPGDALLGIWELEKVMKGSKVVTKKNNQEAQQSLFLRWDKIFVLRNTRDGRQTGVYHIHGHLPEIELFFHNEAFPRQKWSFEVTHNELRLKSLDGDTEISRHYRRTSQF